MKVSKLKMNEYKECCRCEIIQLIEKFNKDKSRKDGVHPQCTNCRKTFYFKNLDKIKKYKERNRERRSTYPKNNQETDNKFRLISNTRSRIHLALDGRSKSSST